MTWILLKYHEIQKKGAKKLFQRLKRHEFVQPIWKTVWMFCKELRTELPYAPAIPHLGIYPKKTKVLIWKDVCVCSLPMCIAPLFITAKDMEAI